MQAVWNACPHKKASTGPEPSSDMQSVHWFFPLRLQSVRTGASHSGHQFDTTGCPIHSRHWEHIGEVWCSQSCERPGVFVFWSARCGSVTASFGHVGIWGQANHARALLRGPFSAHFRHHG